MKLNYNVLETLSCEQKTDQKSSHRRCSVKKGVPKNFAKFTRKAPVLELLLNKAATFRPSTLLKKDFRTGVSFWNWRKACNFVNKKLQAFSCEIGENFKNNFYEEFLQTTVSDLWSVAWVPSFIRSKKYFSNKNFLQVYLFWSKL